MPFLNPFVWIYELCACSVLLLLVVASAIPFALWLNFVRENDHFERFRVPLDVLMVVVTGLLIAVGCYLVFVMFNARLD